MKRFLASIISIWLVLSGWAATVNMSVNVRSGKGTAYITFNGTTKSTTSTTKATINVGSSTATFSIRAVPAAGYKFVSWSDYGTVKYTTAEVTGLAKSPSYITCYMANFEEVAQNVTISVAVANGCSGMGGVSGGGTVQSGQSVIITATPTGSAFFKGWSTTIDGNNIVSTSASTSVTAASDMTYYAVFGQAEMVSISEDHSANGLSKSFVPAPSGGGIDLGLPSGTLWAEKNVGASSEYGFGPYFAWGSTTALTKAPVKAEYPFADSQYDSYTTLPLAYDAAYVNMGSGWRMPTREEMEELVKYAKWDYGVQVWKVSGNGNMITLNLAGHWVTYSSQNGFGRYWTSTKAYGSGVMKRPYYLELTTSTYKVVYDKSTSETNCYYGYTVRAVRNGAPAYTLKVNAKAAGSISTNTYRCNIGQPIQIKPIEVNHNSFLYWLDSNGNQVTTGVDPTTHILTVTMTENLTYTAVFSDTYTDSDTICESDLSTYTWEGEHFTKDNLVKTKTLTSTSGRDSIVTFTLVLNPVYTGITDGDTICESGLSSYEWEGEHFTKESLVKTKTLTSVQGCDSTVTFTLMVQPQYTGIIDSDTICESGLSEYVWEGEHFTKENLTKTKTLATKVAGCDSMVTFTLVLKPVYGGITDGDTICESELSKYEWEGEHFTKDELSKTKTLTTAAGCDSTVTFTLTVNPEYTGVMDGDTICESGLSSYEWEGDHFTKDELTKTKTLTTIQGCDSTVTFTLMLNPEYTDIIDGDTICESGLSSYEWEGEHFTKDELTKTKTLATAAGCDSVVTFTLVVNPEYMGVMDGDTICESGLGSYEWEGEHFTKDELTKTKTLTTIQGCDSTVTFILTVNPEYTDVQTGATICESALPGFNWEGEYFTKDNLVKTKTLTTAAGCDSVVTFTLTVLPIYKDIQDGDVICESELAAYTWEGEHFTKDNLIKTKTLATAAGCDSVVTFTLTVNPEYTGVMDGDTICESGLSSYEWEGEHFTKDELVKTKTLTTIQGCDSVVTFTLVVNPEYAGVMDGDTICESGLSSYEWEGEHFTKDELTKTKTLTTAAGCDSVVTFTLVVNPEYTGVMDGDTICESGLSSYEWEGEHFTMDELVKTKTLTTAAGCDSTVTFTLVLNTIYEDVKDGDTICESELATYTWEGEYFTKDELTKTKTLTTAAGCDSVVTFTLVVNPEYTGVIDGDTICESGLSSYEWEGEHFTKDELVKTKTLTTIQGCDSTVTFTLVVNPEYMGVMDGDTICESGLGSYEWEGEHFTKDELTKTKTLTTIQGCDSTVTFILTVNPEYTDVQTGATICESALPGFTWEGEHFTKDNLVKTKTLTTAAGCDSTVTFTLVLNDAYVVTDGDAVCESELATYTWEGEHFTRDELTKTKTLTSIQGCDSIVTFTLTLKPEYLGVTDGDTICESALPGFTWEGEHFTKDELTKTKTLTTAAGCDSVVTFTLTVNPEYTGVMDGDTICESGLAAYTWEGEHFTKDNLIKTKTLATAAGCDSVVTFTLTVLPIYKDIQDGDIICESELASYTWEDEHFTKGNLVKTKTLATAAGCDSTVTFTLTVLPIYKDIQDGDVICESELAAYTWEGEHFTKDDLIKTKTLATAAGCDSVVTFTLTVNEDKATTDKVVKHQYELPFVWNGIQISDAAQTGTQVNLSTYKGCDSVVTLNLVIWKTVYTTDMQIKCAKELPFMWNGIEIRSAGQTGAQVMLTGVDCDSIVTLDLTVIDEPLKGKVEIETNTCNPDKDYMLLSYVLNAGYPVSYSARFSKAAHEQGFEDITSEDINAVGETSIRIPKPMQAGHPEFYPRPDDYSLTLVVRDLCHDSVTYSVPFTLLYPAWIIAQRWNDVLALYNSTYNGGYDFDRIQWYFRGETIADKGENSSYIQVLPNLAYGEAYYALLRRVGESKAFRTCDVYPVDKNPKNVESRIRIYAVRMDDLRQVGVESEEGGKYYVYDVTGKQLQSGRFGDDGSTTSVIRLSHNYLPGTYVLWLRTDSGEELVKKWVID